MPLQDDLAGPLVELENLGFDRGAHVLIELALRDAPPGTPVRVRGDDRHLALHLRAYARNAGLSFSIDEGGRGFVLRARHQPDVRARSAVQAGDEQMVVDAPPPTWGLAMRGSLVEAGGPTFDFPLADKDTVWADEAGRLYAQAAAAQWDPASAIDWDHQPDLPDAVEAAVVQVMSYLVENETAALIVPARFVAQVHPHFREVMQLLTIQAADEARHIEVFSRRARHVFGPRGDSLGLSSAGGQASLKTLLEENDFALASFLLSVLGEGTFLHLLWFLHRHAPDPLTARIAQLAAQDEARHVAFGVAHLRRHAAHDPTLISRLRAAAERRHDALADTAGLNAAVFDALVLLAAGSFVPEAIGRGHDAVQAMVADMDEGRRRHMEKIGFLPEEAAALSALHTRNFM